MSLRVNMLLAFFALQNCGIEIGNPGTSSGGKPTQGTLSIFFARDLTNDGRSLSLKIQSLDLISGKGDGVIKSNLKSNVEQVDLFTKEEQEDELVAESSQIPVGSYDQLSLNLNDVLPLTYADGKGAERDVQFDDGQSHIFRLDQEFEVVDGKSTSLVININPARSLEESSGDGKPMRFHPFGGAQRGRDGLHYSGETALATAVTVCAYAYEPQPLGELKHLEIDNDKHEGQKQEAYKEPEGKLQLFEGARAQQASIFSVKSEVIKDTDPTCTHAYTVVPVISGKFRLRHLAPASYALRIFKGDGSFIDEASDFSLQIPNSARGD